MAHKQDFWEKLRKWMIPKLGLVVQFMEDVTGKDYYVESGTHNNQFVGRVRMDEESFERVLHDIGFERNPLAALKHLESDQDNYEEGSFRKIGFDDAPDMQLHVILYDGANMNEGESDCIYVYAHWEYRWDVAPVKHYRGKQVNGPKGARMMKDLLDQHGINYQLIRP